MLFTADFPMHEKKTILAMMVSFCGLLPLSAGSFVPTIPQIAKDLDSTGSVVSMAVSFSVCASSVGALCGSTYSTFYGRRPVCLFMLPLFIFASIGVSTAQTIPALLAWRFIQSMGASSGVSIGAGVIGDIYKLEERGQAMGIFFAAILLGSSIAPVVGGLAAHYASWRMLQLYFGVMGIVEFVCMLLYFPETTHPGTRGVEKLYENEHPSWRPVILNPLQPLALLRSPNLLAVSISSFLVLLTDFVLLVPIAYTIGVRYNIVNEAIIGACFIPTGLGNMVGAPVAGRISDRIVEKWRAKRGGEWYPEDRLRAIFISGAMLLVPMSVFLSGLITQYIDGPLGLTLNLLCLFTNGMGVDMALSPSAAYVVDVMHSRSAESMAANNGLRSILLGTYLTGVIPMINTYGVVVTNAVAAGLSLLGFIFLWCTIRYGNQMRAWVDVGYSSTNNN